MVIKNTRTRRKQRDPRRASGNGCPVDSGSIDYYRGRSPIESEVILVFSAATLRYPKHYCGKHQPDVLRNVAIPVVFVHLRIVVEDVLEDQDALEGNEIEEPGTR